MDTQTWWAAACEVMAFIPLSNVGAGAVVATGSAVAGIKFFTEDPRVAIFTLTEESALQSTNANFTCQIKKPWRWDKLKTELRARQTCETEIMKTQIVKSFDRQQWHGLIFLKCQEELEWKTGLNYEKVSATPSSLHLLLLHVFELNV